MGYLFKVLLIFSFFLLGYSVVADTNFERWKYEFRQFAITQGISARTVDSVFHGLLLDPQIIESDTHQAEFVKPIWKYLDAAVSEQRIQRAKKLLKEHHALLESIEISYGVQREYLLAIWGIESNYGSNYGNKNVIRSLASLAYQGRRKEFGKEQLLAALRLIERGDIAPGQMVGSWAGAIGQTQFIPTTYEQYAVDFDGDGVRNLIKSLPDALASTANYLAQSGWKKNEVWGQEVRVAEHFDWSMLDETELDIGCWRHIGIELMHTTQSEHNQQHLASLLLPAGHKGPAFLTQHNFNVIKHYNNANSYALAVSYLSNQIVGKAGVIAPWPTDDVMLTRLERQNLQKILSQTGFDTQGIDGRIGPNTRKALRAWQKQENLVADGYINKERFEHLKEVEKEHLPSILIAQDKKETEEQ